MGFATVRWVPSWVPGAGFQKTAQRWRKTLDELRELPFEACQSIPVGVSLRQRVEWLIDNVFSVQRSEDPTFVSQLAGGLDDEVDEDIEVIKNAAGQAYIGMF